MSKVHERRLRTVSTKDLGRFRPKENAGPLLTLQGEAAKAMAEERISEMERIIGKIPPDIRERLIERLPNAVRRKPPPANATFNRRAE